MAIDVEVGRAAVFLATHSVSQFAQRVQVVGVEKGDAVCERKPLAGFDPGADIAEV
jgi:hypothetical protein